VTIRTGAAATLALVTTVVLAACGSGSEAEMTATLSDDECVYEGDTAPTAGMFTIEVENRTDHFGAFAIAALSAGNTIEDLEPHLEEARQQFAADGTLPAPPPFYEQVVRTGVEAGASSRLPVDVPAGTYALMCFVDDLPTWRAYPAAQLDVA
jgi:hypothetical protein